MTRTRSRLDRWQKTQGEIAKLQAAQARPRLSPRQKLAQGLSEWAERNGAKVISPLPLKDGTALRLDTPSINAAQVSADLTKLGFSIRFENACLQMRPGAVIEMVREGHKITGERRHAGPMSVTTFSIDLPPD